MAPILLYSANTYLAFRIGQFYYGDNHYVWCSEVFDARVREQYGQYADIPPTSNPYEIYGNLFDAVHRGDRHSPKIAENKTGILNGAARKLSLGVISKEQYDEIGAVIEAAELREFRPLMYVIPYNRKVAKLVQPVPVSRRAHPLSREFLMEALPRAYFDIIELRR